MEMGQEKIWLIFFLSNHSGGGRLTNGKAEWRMARYSVDADKSKLASAVNFIRRIQTLKVSSILFIFFHFVDYILYPVSCILQDIL